MVEVRALVYNSLAVANCVFRGGPAGPGYSNCVCKIKITKTWYRLWRGLNVNGRDNPVLCETVLYENELPTLAFEDAEVGRNGAVIGLIPALTLNPSQ